MIPLGDLLVFPEHWQIVSSDGRGWLMIGSAPLWSPVIHSAPLSGPKPHRPNDLVIQVAYSTAIHRMYYMTYQYHGFSENPDLANAAASEKFWICCLEAYKKYKMRKSGARDSAKLYLLLHCWSQMWKLMSFFEMP